MKFGDKVKCNITGFTGILTARNTQMFGLDQWYVISEELSDDGCTREGWFETQRLVLYGGGVDLSDADEDTG